MADPNFPEIQWWINWQQRQLARIMRSYDDDQDLGGDAMTAGAVNEPELTDRHALDRIHEIMSGHEWDGSTVERVAEIVELTGREIKLPDLDSTAADG